MWCMYHREGAPPSILYEFIWWVPKESIHFERTEFVIRGFWRLAIIALVLSNTHSHKILMIQQGKPCFVVSSDFWENAG